MAQSKEYETVAWAKVDKEIANTADKYLTSKITVPLGDPALREVHTNSFLWTKFPNDFPLKNWKYVVEVLNDAGALNTGYTNARWYIEGIDITVDITGKGEMTFNLNAFPSRFDKTYVSNYQKFQEEYTKTQDSVNKTNNSSTSNTTNAVNKPVLNQDWIKKYNISSDVTKQVEKICNATNTVLQNVKAIFNWMNKNLPYEGYSNTKYGASGILKRGKGNCVDHAHLFAAMCRSIGVKCNYIHNPCCGSGGHVYNKVYIDGKGTIVDTGRDNASWGSHWGNSGCPSEKENISF